jgi:hypothetical protein
MNVSSDIVNNSCVMSEVINNNKFKKLTWTYHKKNDSEIAKCHDDSSKLISVQFSDHEGPTRIYFSSKEHVDRIRVNYYTKNNVLVDTIYCTVYYGIVSWVQYEFDDEFKFEFYE